MSEISRIRYIFILVFLFFSVGCHAQQETRTNNEETESTSVSGDLRSQYSTVIDTSNLISLSRPSEDISTVDATVYLNSIQKFQRPDTTFLIIKGDFSNGCSHLKEVSHSIRGDTLYMALEAWKPKNRMCTQVLTPFTYLYDRITREDIQEVDFYMIRGEKKAF